MTQSTDFRIDNNTIKVQKLSKGIMTSPRNRSPSEEFYDNATDKEKARVLLAMAIGDPDLVCEVDCLLGTGDARTQRPARRQLLEESHRRYKLQKLRDPPLCAIKPNTGWNIENLITFLRDHPINDKLSRAFVKRELQQMIGSTPNHLNSALGNRTTEEPSENPQESQLRNSLDEKHPLGNDSQVTNTFVGNGAGVKIGLEDLDCKVLMTRALGLPGCDFQLDPFKSQQNQFTPTDEMLLEECQRRAGTTWREVMIVWLKEHPVQEAQEVCVLVRQVRSLVEHLLTETSGERKIDGAHRPNQSYRSQLVAASQPQQQPPHERDISPELNGTHNSAGLDPRLRNLAPIPVDNDWAHGQDDVPSNGQQEEAPSGWAHPREENNAWREPSPRATETTFRATNGSTTSGERPLITTQQVGEDSAALSQQGIAVGAPRFMGDNVLYNIAEVPATPDGSERHSAGSEQVQAFDNNYESNLTPSRNDTDDMDVESMNSALIDMSLGASTFSVSSRSGTLSSWSNTSTLTSSVGGSQLTASSAEQERIRGGGPDADRGLFDLSFPLSGDDDTMSDIGASVAPTRHSQGPDNKKSLRNVPKVVKDRELPDKEGRVGRYTGQCTRTLRGLVPHGEGKMEYAGGVVVYEGQWSKGVWEGYGRLDYAENDYYAGNFARGTFSGRGVRRWPDGSEYDGEWRDGKRSGKGTLHHADGGASDGSWADDKLHGHGRRTLVDNSQYKGTFVNGVQQGDCQYRDCRGLDHEGVWVSNRKLSDNSRYDGLWKDGKPHGYGKCKHGNGDVYKGECVEAFERCRRPVKCCTKKGMALRKRRLCERPQRRVWENCLLGQGRIRRGVATRPVSWPRQMATSER